MMGRMISQDEWVKSVYNCTTYVGWEMKVCGGVSSSVFLKVFSRTENDLSTPILSFVGWVKSSKGA
jgi:hypothetical protein